MPLLNFGPETMRWRSGRADVSKNLEVKSSNLDAYGI